MKLREKGEIATLLTVGTMVVIAVTAITSSLFLNRNQSTGSRASLACGTATYRSGPVAQYCSTICAPLAYAGSTAVGTTTRECCCKTAAGGGGGSSSKPKASSSKSASGGCTNNGLTCTTGTQCCSGNCSGTPPSRYCAAAGSGGGSSSKAGGTSSAGGGGNGPPCGSTPSYTDQNTCSTRCAGQSCTSCDNLGNKKWICPSAANTPTCTYKNGYDLADCNATCDQTCTKCKDAGGNIKYQCGGTDTWKCSDYNNQANCPSNCYWWDSKCNDKPQCAGTICGDGTCCISPKKCEYSPGGSYCKSPTSSAPSSKPSSNPSSAGQNCQDVKMTCGDICKDGDPGASNNVWYKSGATYYAFPKCVGFRTDAAVMIDCGCKNSPANQDQKRACNTQGASCFEPVCPFNGTSMRVEGDSCVDYFDNIAWRTGVCCVDPTTYCKPEKTTCGQICKDAGLFGQILSALKPIYKVGTNYYLTEDCKLSLTSATVLTTCGCDNTSANQDQKRACKTGSCFWPVCQAVGGKSQRVEGDSCVDYFSNVGGGFGVGVGPIGVHIPEGTWKTGVCCVDPYASKEAGGTTSSAVPPAAPVSKVCTPVGCQVVCDGIPSIYGKYTSKGGNIYTDDSATKYASEAFCKAGSPALTQQEAMNTCCEKASGYAAFTTTVTAPVVSTTYGAQGFAAGAGGGTCTAILVNGVPVACATNL